MWALPDGNITMTGEGHADQLSGCCFYPSGTQLVTSSGDTTVQIWDFSKRGCVLTSEGQAHAVQHCSWHLCGDFMASASVDNTSKTYGMLTVRDADIQCVAMKIQSTALSFFRSPTLLSLGLLTRLYLSGMPECTAYHFPLGDIHGMGQPCCASCYN
ncbi:sperm-associated antigen 16 protein-like isoform X1 [Columba livia]|uniref:sperm-associated antigen 16 protein-like isoform X1 n=1 Tax=Columba livia TaxID=8932 RepID=UPI0031BB0C00